MKKITAIAILAIGVYGCGNSYEKTPEDWTLEICGCASEKGNDSQECFDKLDELKNYYSDADYEMHDKATTDIGTCAPELLMNHMDKK